MLYRYVHCHSLIDDLRSPLNVIKFVFLGNQNVNYYICIIVVVLQNDFDVCLFLWVFSTYALFVLHDKKKFTYTRGN